MPQFIDHQFVHSSVPHFERAVLAACNDEVVFVQIQTTDWVVNACVQSLDHLVLVIWKDFNWFVLASSVNQFVVWMVLDWVCLEQYWQYSLLFGLIFILFHFLYFVSVFLDDFGCFYVPQVDLGRRGTPWQNPTVSHPLYSSLYI